MHEIFRRGNFIDWAVPCLFCAMETEISALILEISIRDYGNARATMHSVLKSLTAGGFVPACLVEMRNLNSKAFQLKVGFNEEPTVEKKFRPKLDFDQVLLNR